MFKRIVLLPALVGTLGMVDLPDMIEHSRLLHCEAYTCVNLTTDEVIELEQPGDPIYGYIVDFTKPYSVEQIKEASPHVLKHYRETLKP